MGKIIKIVTGCNFVGCETVHYVEVPDDAGEDYLNGLVEEYIERDVEPCGGYEEASEEEAEENGYEIE